MKKLEIIACILFWAAFLYIAACWLDIAFSVDPIMPTQMHNWNLIKILAQMN